MTSRLHEGMTRTQSPRRTGSPLRLAALIALCAAVLLILGWAIFSPLGGTGEHQAQAQTVTEGDEEGAPPEGSEAEGGFSAFGDPQDPFIPVVPLVESGNGGGNGNGGDNNAGDADNNGNGNNGDGKGSPKNANGGNGKDQNSNTLSPNSVDDPQNIGGNVEPQETTPSAPPANGGAGGGSGAVGSSPDRDEVCQNPEDFQELLCEEGAPGGDRTTSSQPGGSGEIEDDRDGGSGRSGAGEPTDTFRNGGPAPGK